MPRQQLRRDRALIACACWDCLVGTAALSQSRFAAAIWALVCLTATWFAVKNGSQWWRGLVTKWGAVQAVAWALAPFVVSRIADYCGPCVPPRRSMFGANWAAALAAYLLGSLGSAVLYTALLNRVLKRPVSQWRARLAALLPLGVYLAAALSPAKGADAAPIAPALLAASLWHSFAGPCVLDADDNLRLELPIPM